MRRSRAEKAKSRERILDEAARRVRAGGPGNISIGELMKAADLTHGGFYKHFASRDALVEAAVERAAAAGKDLFGEAQNLEGSAAVKLVVERYLSAQHRDNAATGCAIAALATYVSNAPDPRTGQPVRDLAERGFDRMNAALGGDSGTQDTAIFAWCAMVGALTLSRMFTGEARSDQILGLAREQLLAWVHQVQSQPVADNGQMSGDMPTR